MFHHVRHSPKIERWRLSGAGLDINRRTSWILSSAHNHSSSKYPLTGSPPAIRARTDLPSLKHLTTNRIIVRSPSRFGGFSRITPMMGRNGDVGGHTNQSTRVANINTRLLGGSWNPVSPGSSASCLANKTWPPGEIKSPGHILHPT